MNVFVGRLDRSLPDESAHAYVPNLQAQGSGYTFVDGSGVAQRLLGNFGAEREVQEAAVVDALKVCFAPSVDSNFGKRFSFSLSFPLCCLNPKPLLFFPCADLVLTKLVNGWGAVEQSIAAKVAAVYCSLVAGECAMDMCLKLVHS